MKIDDGIKYVSVNPDNLNQRTDLGVNYLGFACQDPSTHTYETTNSSSKPSNCAVYSLNP